MKDTNGLTLNLTRTACKVAAKNGWSAEDIQACFDNPKKVYDSKTRPGQVRVVNETICIVGVAKDDKTFLGITMYPNGSKAPVK